jgi:hypothetical protein
MTAKKTTEISKGLREKVNKAIKNGRYFVAVIEYKPNPENDLEFYYAQQDFPNSEVFPSLQRVTEMFKKETMKLVEDKK